MGYTLIIGQANISIDEDQVSSTASIVSLDYAPAYGEPTDYSNERWPSYVAWGDTMRELGLYDVMFDGVESGRKALISEHPGICLITKDHVEIVEAKIAAYKILHPTHFAKYPLLKSDGPLILFQASDNYVYDPRYDGNLCRGEWLAFWLRWAFENCSKPVFVNS